MIEGLQVIAYQPFFDIKSPGNMNTFFTFFDEVVNVDLIDTEELTNEMGYYPEMDAFSLNFQNAGYANYYLVPNLGFLFYVGFGILVLHFVNVGLYHFAKRFPIIEPQRRKLSTWLYWNGSFRYFIEGYMNLTLFSLLNIKNLDWSG